MRLADLGGGLAHGDRLGQALLVAGLLQDLQGLVEAGSAALALDLLVQGGADQLVIEVPAPVTENVDKPR